MTRQTYVRTGVSGVRAAKLALLTTLSLASTVAMAQAASGAGNAEGDIIVTASKRGAVDIQDIATNISAVGADQLLKTGAVTLDDIARQTPGVTIVGGQSNKTIYIRGLASQAGAPQVAIYLDETPISGIGGTNVRQTDIGLYDVQQVEVLRGPQGTLYGAGSQGGTIRYITNKPKTTEFEGSIGSRVGFRSRDGGMRYDLNGMVNLPIAEDKVAIRGVGFWRRVDGFVDIVNRNQSDKEKTYGGRAQILLKPTETTDILFTGSYQKTDMPDSSRVLTISDSRSSPLREPYYDKLRLFNLTVNQDVGFGTVTGTISRYKRDAYFVFDVSQFVAPQFGSVNQTSQTKTTTGEFRFASNFDLPFQIVTGVFFEDRDLIASSDGKLVNPATGLPFDPRVGFFLVEDDGNTKSKAAFFNGIWNINDRLSVEAGIRFYEIKRRSDSSLVQDIFGRPLGPSPTQRAKSSDNSKKFQISYKASDDALIYATYSEGFREGGPNAVGLVGTYPLSYDPDVVKNYELGFKTSWLDKQMILNGAVYYMKWDDVQVQQFDSTGAFAYTANAGKADLKGVELEGRFEPDGLSGLAANFGLRYSNQKLTQDNPLVVGPPPNPFAGQDGDRIPYTNKFQGNIGLEQRFPLGDVEAFVRGDLSYVGKAYTTFTAADPLYRRLNGYTLVDLRAGIEQSRWDVALYAKNVFNKRAFVDVTVEQRPGLPDRVLTTEPREIGVQVALRF